MTGPSLPSPSAAAPARRSVTRAILPTVMEIGIVVLLALNLKFIYDTHTLAERDQQLMEGIAAVVSERNQREVRECYREVPRRMEILRLERHLDKVVDPTLRRAFRDYLSGVESNIREKHECDSLAKELGVKTR